MKSNQSIKIEHNDVQLIFTPDEELRSILAKQGHANDAWIAEWTLPGQQQGFYRVRPYPPEPDKWWTERAPRHNMLGRFDDSLLYAYRKDAMRACAQDFSYIINLHHWHEYMKTRQPPKD